MSDIILSCVIPVKNEEQNIARCLKSVIAGTRDIAGTEILVVDSFSTDRTVAVACEFPVSVIRLPRHWPHSPAAGRYTGVRYARGEFILVIDGDMELRAGWLDHAISFMRSHPRAAAVVGRIHELVCLPDGSVSDMVPGRNSPKKDVVHEIPYVYESSLFRRNHLLEVGNFHPYLRAEEEAEASYRLRKGGYSLFYLPVDSVFHYTLRRETIQETRRRLRRNLTAGVGDMFAWALRSGYFSIIWARFRIFLAFMVLTGGAGTAAVFGLVSGQPVVTLSAVFFVLLLMALFVIRKRSLTRGLLSFLNMSIISLQLIRSLFRRVPPPERYPDQPEWLKRAD